jgi:hypothetical protein
MDIRIIAREDIDKTKWNSCVHYAANGNVFGYLWYLDATAREWEGLVLGDYEAVMPLTPTLLSWGRKAIVQPPLVRELAVYSPYPLSDDLVKAFWQAIPATYTGVDLQMDAFCKGHGDDWQNVTRTNYFLPMLEAYELLRERYRQVLIDQLGVAKDAGLFPSSNIKPEKIAEHYRTQHPELSDEAFHGLQRIMYNSLHRGWGFASAIINREQEVLASDFFITSHGRIMSLAPAVSPKGQQVHALEYLYDLIVRQQAGRPNALDFNNAQSEADFAQGFGAFSYDYFQVRRLPVRKWYEVWR